MKYIVTLNGKNYEVEVDKAQAVLLNVTDAPAPAVQPAPSAPAPAPAVQPAPPAPAPAPAAAQPAPAPAAPQAHVAGEEIKAPMPGTIVAVKVAPGTPVKNGQVLVVLEAMKMENEIVAPHDATVAQVLVSQGASVESGVPLVILN